MAAALTLAREAAAQADPSPDPGQTAPPPASPLIPGSPGPAQSATNNAAPLTLQERRALMYLHSRLHQVRQARQIAQDILREHPRDRETLQLLANLALESKEPAEALRVTGQWLEYYPRDPVALVLRAEAFNRQGRYDTAYEILQRLKQEQFSNRPFPYEAELAAAASRTGDWPQAVRSYRSVLDDPNVLPEVEQDVRGALDELYRKHLPQLRLQESLLQLRSGSIWRTLGEWNQPLNKNYRLGLLYARDDVAVEPEQFLRTTHSDRFDALAGVQARWSRWRSELWAGGSSEGFIYRAGAARAFRQAGEFSAFFYGNHRATDSLLLEALDGREDRFALGWSSPPDRTWSMSLEASGRRVLIDEETVGWGYNIQATVERPIWTALPDLRLSYRGLATGFSRESDNPNLVNDVAAPGARPIDKLLLLDNIVEPINVHGLFLTWQQEIDQYWTYRLLGGADYSFERSVVGYSAEAGVSFFPSKAAELTLDGGYSTSASTSNQESERLGFTFAFRYYF